MTDKPQPDKFDWATELSDAQGHVTLSAQEAKEIGARLRSMRVKLKTYEDFGDAGSDVQLLRMGYTAARLEIESLKAQLHAAKQINTAQFWLFTSSIPGSALRASHWQAPAQAAAPAQADEYPALVCDYCGALTPDPWHSSGMLHGKMSKHIHSCDACCRGAAQAAPTYKDSTPELHIGDSAFESWYNSFSPAHKSDKQRARDAYAAGMGDPLVTAAPAAVAGPVVNRTTVIEWLDANDIEVTDRQMDGLFHFAAPTTHPAPQQEAQEPVAQTLASHAAGEAGDCLFSRFVPSGTPLYAAPQPVEREPLTREQVKAICVESGYETATLQERVDFINGIRHAERHHGIKGGQHGTE